MPTRSLPVESRSRRRPSGAGFRRAATQMALSRCAIAHRGADWYFWRGTPAIACVAAQPPCSWHLPEAGQATGGPCPALEPNGCIDIRLHPVLPTTANVGWPSPGIPVVFPTSAGLAASGFTDPFTGTGAGLRVLVSLPSSS